MGIDNRIEPGNRAIFHYFVKNVGGIKSDQVRDEIATDSQLIKVGRLIENVPLIEPGLHAALARRSFFRIHSGSQEKPIPNAKKKR